MSARRPAPNKKNMPVALGSALRRREGERSTNHSDNDTPGNDNFASDTTQSSSSQPLAGGDPKVFRPTPYWLPSTAKPTTPLPSASTGSPTSAPIVKTEPLSTSTLKIRLPSLTSFKDSLVTAPPSVPDNHSRTRTSGRARTKKAPECTFASARGPGDDDRLAVNW